jgi:plastocyanin
VPTAVPFNITALDYRFSPSSATFPVGTKVRISLANGGEVDHNLVLKNSAGREILRITVLPLQQQTQEYTFQTTGTYAFVCDLSDHQQRGMVGSISIR